MTTPNVPTRPQPGDTPAGYQPRIVVKLREEPALVAAVASPGRGGEGPRGPRALEALRERFPGAPVERLVRSVSPARLQAMMRDARRAAGPESRPLPDPLSFYTVKVPRGMNPQEAVARARGVEGVERAYLQAAPTRRPVTPGDDPRAATQGYLGPAPGGIDARFAWTVPGGDGRGVTFCDQEGGWRLTHEDLRHVRLLSGVNLEPPQHGTSVLGEVVAQDNTLGCVGIAPLANGRCISEWRTASDYSITDAIFAAFIALEPGAVLLIETQTTVEGSTHLPVEVHWDVWLAIRVVTLLGLVVVEAGGNGANDLDTFSHPADGLILKRGHAQFRESGAIMVGAATSAAPHRKLGFTNFGSRIDCYAWGENVVTTDGDSDTDYTATFNGTSSASPIVAGAAVLVQGLAARYGRRRYTPSELRRILSTASNGTPAPAADKIGVMPNLRAIIRAESLAPPVGDFPLPVGDTRVAALIDAGHGGEVEEEEPAYAGARGPSAEKDINLGIARRVRAHFGGAAALTRDGDYGVALGDRARLAREAAAPVFVSIHSNTGRTDRPGPEVWVYGGPEGGTDPGSRSLAQRISGELSRLGAGPVPVRAGDLALLRPALYGGGTAACLVEAGSLAHPGMAERLREPAAQDAIGAAVARGVAGYLSGGDSRYGSTALLDAPSSAEPWQADREDAAPAQACFHALAEAEQANWWDTPGSAVALADTAPAALQPLLRYHGVTYATFAPHEGRFLAALTEHLRRAGVLAAAAPALTVDTMDAAVRDFQRRRSLPVNGLADGDTLWALQRDWAIGRRLGVRRVDADRVAGSGGYDSFRLRSDIVERYNALRRDVLAAGGVITSAGSMRDLTATVTAGRSTTSMHYSGLALDLATDTGMRNPARDRYIVTQDGRRWRVWCRSDTAPEQTLDAIVWASGATRTQRVTARAFDFTALAERHGFSRIGARSTFPASYMSAEWWHFQCEAVLTPFVSQFGTELLSLGGDFNERNLQTHEGLWSNRKRIFKSLRDGGWH